MRQRGSFRNLDHNQKVHVLYNGVNRKLKKFPSKKKEILFVGRLVFEKGVDLYVEVVKSIAPYYPDWNFGLTGSFRLGDNNNVNSYASKVIKNFNNIVSQAKFYGFKDHDFVQDKMKAASIIIIPSLWEERFGLVAPEAMSNGIAIIASKVGGIPEIIKDNGILIENIDFKKLEKTLMGVINNNKSRLAYQKKACENFQLKSTFSSKQLYNYRKIIYRHHF
jgi:glycosyltransferase involved in cell wall biosynthesis